MKRPRASWVVALAMLPIPFAMAGATGDGGEGSSATGPHYRVFAHLRGENAAHDALEVAERSWGLTRDLLDLARDPERSLGPPLELHLYRNKEDYTRTEQRLTHGAFRDNESFSHWDSMTAHVALAPPVPEGATGIPLFSSQTREAIAHESAHLAVYEALDNYRWHPTWFAEGVAMAVAREGIADVEQHPRYASNLLHAKALLTSGRLPTMHALLADHTDELNSDERYALWQVLFDTLRAHEGLVPRLREVIAGAGSGPGVRVKALAFLRDEVGLEPLDRELRARIEATRPGWEELVRCLDTSSDPWVQRAFPDVDAFAWRRIVAESSCDGIEGTFALLAPGTELRVHLGRHSTSKLALALRGSRVLVNATCGESDASTAAEIPELVVGSTHRFEARIEKERVRLFLDGEEVVSLAPPRSFTEPDNVWGLATSAGGAGAWSAIRTYSTP